MILPLHEVANLQDRAHILPARRGTVLSTLVESAQGRLIAAMFPARCVGRARHPICAALAQAAPLALRLQLHLLAAVNGVRIGDNADSTGSSRRVSPADARARVPDPLPLYNCPRTTGWYQTGAWPAPSA